MSDDFIGTWKKVEASHTLIITKDGGIFYVNIDGNFDPATVISDNELRSNSSKYGHHKWVLKGGDVIVECGKYHFDKICK